MDKRVSYNGLWKLLIENNIKSCLELSKKIGIAPSTLTRMRNNEYVAMDVLVRLDGTVPIDDIKNMIDDSYELTKPKKRGKK